MTLGAGGKDQMYLIAEMLRFCRHPSVFKLAGTLIACWRQAQTIGKEIAF